MQLLNRAAFVGIFGAKCVFLNMCALHHLYLSCIFAKVPAKYDIFDIIDIICKEFQCQSRVAVQLSNV